MLRKKLRRQAFTLVELIVSMAVFALLSMVVVQLFSATQKLWVSNNQKNSVSAEGRSALNLIASFLSEISAAPEVHAQTSETNSKDAIYKGGSDHLELSDDGPDGSSKLYFATKTIHPGIKDSDASVADCFIGIQVVNIDSASDPDDGCNVLVMSVKTDADDSFSKQFPKSQKSSDTQKEHSQIKDLLDDDSSVYNDNGTRKITRLATCVISFNVWLCNSADEIIHTKKNTGSATRKYDVDASDYPTAIEMELVLMDRSHYEQYKTAEDSEKTKLVAQYGRTFRKVVWLGKERNLDDYDEYNPKKEN